VPVGLANSDWVSIREAYETGRHAFQPVESGWQAWNPGQQWTTTFDKRGFLAKPRGADWQWGLELDVSLVRMAQQSFNIGTTAICCL
jgi:hypothetical protein